MNRKTVIIISFPIIECWGTFKGLCESKGWVYQSLANAHKVPKVGQPVTIGEFVIHRVICR